MNNKLLLQNYTHNDLLNQYNFDQMYKETLKKEEDPIEWKYFLEFIKDTPHLKPYRTEWTVYNEDLKIAGSIDMIYENPDGTLSIYDWKRVKDITRVNLYNKYAISECICHLPDSNFWHYALQLNTYKAIIEEKYNKIVKDLYLVRLYPDLKEETSQIEQTKEEETNYELIKIPDLKKEIHDLFEERRKQQQQQQQQQQLNLKIA